MDTKVKLLLCIVVGLVKSFVWVSQRPLEGSIIVFAQSLSKAAWTNEINQEHVRIEFQAFVRPGRTVSLRDLPSSTRSLIGFRFWYVICMVFIHNNTGEMMMVSHTTWNSLQGIRMPMSWIYCCETDHDDDDTNTQKVTTTTSIYYE